MSGRNQPAESCQPGSLAVVQRKPLAEAAMQAVTGGGHRVNV